MKERPTPQNYFINQELIEEMIRLKMQAQLVTDAMDGVLPEQRDENVSQVHKVLDVACGPGEWVMAMAEAYPHIEQVVGVDKSQRMIAYAAAQAEAEDRPCVFRCMDVTQPMDFPDESFDLVNTRFILGFMKREQWPLLLKECFRLLRPGGILRITEQESGFSNDPTYQQYMDLWGNAWRSAGHSFAHTNAYIGATIVLKQLMRDVGFIDPKHRPITIDLSVGEPGHQDMMENFVQALKLAAPFLLNLHIITQKEINDLAIQMENLIGQAGFCAYWVLQSIWSQKPLKSE